METLGIVQHVKTVREAIDRLAESRGESIFLVSPESGRSLTFAGFQEQTRAIAVLLHKEGLRQGDKVAFLLDNGLFTAQLFLGTMYAGLVSVPLNVRAGVSQLAYTLDHSDAKVIFVEEQYQQLAREALASVSRVVRVIAVDVDDLATSRVASLSEFPATTVAAEDQALLMYTSGSVGQPKGAIHSHRTLLAHGRNSISSHQLTSADRSLLVLPIYHINAECVTLMPTLLSGGSVVVPHHFNVSEFWDLLDRNLCTWSAVVPTIISQLLDWKDPRGDQRETPFKRIRFLRSSSAPLSPSLQREFLDKFNLRLIQAMGSSEAGNIFSNPQAPGENKIGTPGLAWGFETRIIDRDGTDVAQGQPGEVLIRGAAVMQGYYKNPEETAAVLDSEGWMHTGDLAYQDEDGYFFVIGRSKELIIKGGMNIAPRQIDEVLESHPSVLEAAVVGVPDRYVGEDLIAFAVLRSGMIGDEREMLAFCETRLGHFKTPTRIHFVNDLPKGPSGKVQRLRLLEVAEQLVTEGPVFTTANVDESGLSVAESEIEQTIGEIWAEVLKQPRIDPNSNFFSLGGHSMMAIQCMAQMREKLPVAFSLSDFFEHATVSQQAELVRNRLHAAVANGRGSESSELAAARELALTEPKESGPGRQQIATRRSASLAPLSPAQRGIWFFEELAPGVPLYNESEAVRLTGNLNADAMEQALNAIVSRHEILRTTIGTGEDGPVAIVHRQWPLQMKRIDLSKLAAEDREAEVQRLLIDEPRRPYQLATEPGIRATLVRLSANQHVFILMMHHLVCDWTSEGVLWRELSSAYRAIARGEPVVLDALPIQYGDYALWQQQQTTEQNLAEDLAYWKENLSGAPELLELPTDRPRPPVQTYRGARKRFELNSSLSNALRERSRQEKMSLFTVFAAALNALLYRYTGSEDIVLGIPIADREQKELQSVIGFLLHTHALRTRFTGDTSFRGLLAIVQRAAISLYSHREVSFDRIVSTIRPERNLAHSPIFQVMINWRDPDQQLSFIGLEGLAVESLLAETKTSKFDMTLMLTDSGAEIGLEVEYSTDLFDEERIARMFDHYQTLLEAVATDPAQRISQLPVLTDSERQKLSAGWNSTETVYPREKRIDQLFSEQAARTPDAIAVEFDERRITYRELDRRSNQLAHHLRKFGVEPDDLIGICVERSINMMVGVLGILKAGGAYVPLDPAYPRERLAFMLRDSGARLLVTERKLTHRIPNDCSSIFLDRDWARIAYEPLTAPACEAHGENLAYVIYTSGSTGQPKGVEINHRSVVNLLSSMSRKPGLGAHDTLLAVTTLSFDIAALEMFLPLTVGAKMVIASRDTAIDGDALLSLLRTSGATVIQATPITFRMLIEAGWSFTGKPLKVLCGGEALPRELADQILKRATELWNCYGPTETTVWSTRSKIRSRGSITIGGPIANTQLYILDRNGALCPIGTSGELHIGGDGLARGYHARPELTREKFIEDRFSATKGARMYKTGDLARYRSDGAIEYLGRIDHQVKIRGFRIELGEIEAALRAHSKVGECVAVARDSASGEKQLVAYYVPVERGDAPDVQELRAILKRSLPEYMVPSALMMIDKMPLTSNGKIDRKALPDPELARSRAASSYSGPSTPIEEALQEIWNAVLGLKQIGVHDNFFALGGHSLQATRLIAEVNKSIDHKFSVPVFFQNPTIAAMARVLEEEKHAEIEENRQAFYVVLRRGAKTLAVISEDARMVELRKAKGRPPFFMVDSFPYFIDVVKLLGTDQPVVSLVAHGSTSGNDYSIAREAAGHVQTMLEHQPEGPYMIGGSSAAGIVAYEIALQLRELGHEVGLLVLFDTLNPHFMREYSHLRRSIAYHNAELKQMRWSDVPGWVAAKLFNRVTKKSPTKTAIPETPAPASTTDQYGFSSQHVEARIAAARLYRPRPYAGKLLVFTRHRELGGRYRDAWLGWNDTVHGEIEVCQLATREHLEIFKSDHDRTLVALKLRQAFDEVSANCPSKEYDPPVTAERLVG